jgi:hypothetical protein
MPASIYCATSGLTGPDIGPHLAQVLRKLADQLDCMDRPTVGSKTIVIKDAAGQVACEFNASIDGEA